MPPIILKKPLSTSWMRSGTSWTPTKSGARQKETDENSHFWIESGKISENAAPTLSIWDRYLDMRMTKGAFLGICFLFVVWNGRLRRREGEVTSWAWLAWLPLFVARGAPSAVNEARFRSRSRLGGLVMVSHLRLGCFHDKGKGSGAAGPFHQITLLTGIHSIKVQELV